MFISFKAFFATFIAFGTVFIKDSKRVKQDGFFQHYNTIVWIVVMLNVRYY